MSDLTTRSHDGLVERQFGPRALAYVQSAVHSTGRDLDAIEARAAELKPRRALDLGTGGGHVAYRLAAHAEEVVACDLSQEMLDAVTRTAGGKGLANISATLAAAENLPFRDEEFDFLTCRFSAHHWHDFDGGLRQARRVMRRGSPAMFVDVVCPGQPLLDTHLQAIEVLRDPSHGRDYSVAEWVAATSRAGFSLTRADGLKLRIDFASWIARMRTPELMANAVRALQKVASEEVRQYFRLESDGSYVVDVMILEVVA